MVRGIKDDLIDTLDFRSKLEIAISDILILPVCILKVKPKVNKKNQEKQGLISLLICFQMDTQYKNLKYPIQNLRYPIKPKRGGLIPNCLQSLSGAMVPFPEHRVKEIPLIGKAITIRQMDKVGITQNLSR